MRIYTKTGDSGETSLGNGKRVTKDSLRVSAYGDVDEANSVIGLAREECSVETKEFLLGVQKEFLVLGSDLASPPEKQVPRITQEHVSRIEKKIDEIDARLAPLTRFIVPGGCKASALLHCARTVVRRAERSVTKLAKTEPTNSECLIYLNRISDLLFVLARHENKLGGGKDEYQTDS